MTAKLASDLRRVRRGIAGVLGRGAPARERERRCLARARDWVEGDEHEDHRTHQHPDLSQAHENVPVTRFGRMSGRLQGPVWSVLIVAHERRCLVEERLAVETAFRVVPGHFR